MSYNIVRFYQKGTKRVIATNLTLKEAKQHCTDPETSSRTATSSYAKNITAKHGAWFDGYTES